MKLILAFAARFVRADTGSQLVEDAVDEFMAVGAAESFGNFDGFIDDNRVWGFRNSAQLMAGNQQNGAFDRAEVFFVAVEQGADFSMYSSAWVCAPKNSLLNSSSSILDVWDSSWIFLAISGAAVLLMPA